MQARLGSSRFPGKILEDLDGKPMLQHLLDEIKKCKRADKVILAIPWHDVIPVDHEPIVRGPNQDVAARFSIAVKEHPCDYFIRVCADSPLITAYQIDSLALCRPKELVGRCLAEWPLADRHGTPQMVNTEMWLKALPFFDDHDREHVTTFFTRRLVVDTPEDLDYVRRWIEFSKLVS